MHEGVRGGCSEALRAAAIVRAGDRKVMEPEHGAPGSIPSNALSFSLCPTDLADWARIYWSQRAFLQTGASAQLPNRAWGLGVLSTIWQPVKGPPDGGG